MYLTQNKYIILFVLFCALYYFIINYNIFENFDNTEDNKDDTTTVDSSHPFIRNDYNELDKPYNSTINKNLLYNEEDIIKFKYDQPTLRITGMMTDTNVHT
jgi:hypothetical protein